jgi:hypothetical protein
VQCRGFNVRYRDFTCVHSAPGTVVSSLTSPRWGSFDLPIRYLAPDFGQEVARDDVTQTLHRRHPREYAIQG